MEHRYNSTLEWKNPTNELNVRTFSRNHTVTFENKPPLQTSADPTFRGDKTLYNPEEMLLAALSSCHMLSYLYRCALNGVVVTSYTDNATGLMITDGGGGGKFSNVTLRPVVTVQDESMVEKANTFHQQAKKDCFIANSVNFEVLHQPVTRAAQRT